MAKTLQLDSGMILKLFGAVSYLILFILRLPLLAQCLFHELPPLHRHLPHRHRPQRLQEPALPSHHHPILRLRLCRHHRHHHHGHHWPLFCCGDSKAECSKGVFSNLGGERWELIFKLIIFLEQQLFSSPGWLIPLLGSNPWWTILVAPIPAALGCILIFMVGTYYVVLH